MDINIGKYLLIVLMIITKLKYSLSTVYYSGTRNETFHKSKEYCESVGGSLLTYGKLMMTAVRICEKPDEDPSLWTATPWYNLDLTCYNGTASKILEGSDKDKHLAICADFCQNSNYNRIGLWTTKCECYEESITLESEPCSYEQCPLNPVDRCGLHDSGIIYKKVDQKGSYCRYRKFKSLSDGGIIENLDLCTEQKPFLCKVGNSETVQCSVNGLSEAVSSASNEGLIIGVVVGVGLLLIVILAIILVIRFRRNNVAEERETEEQVKDLNKDQGTFHFTSSTRNRSSPFGSHEENHY